MPSPFPGMTPYLEQDDAWHDLHERFPPTVAEVLGAQLIPNHIVKIDEHIDVHDYPDPDRRLVGRADLSIAASVEHARQLQSTELLEPPVQIELPEMDVEGVSYIEILDRHHRVLITAIELLSPSNKRGGPNRERYLAERRQLLASPAHLVEIDLLRVGEPMPADDRPACDYSVMVSRSEKRPRVGFWPIRLRDRLPTIPVPVRSPDPDARLDLQTILHRIYDAAGYHYYIYGGSPDPPLSPEIAAWARGLLAASD